MTERECINEPLACDIAVIGGGSAGLAAAVAAAECARLRVLVLERESYLGGVLPQCVHDGFGLHCYREPLTGPEYARRWSDRARAAGVQVALSTTVLSVERVDEGPQPAYELDAVGEQLGGTRTIRARSVVCATGCRERTRGAMQIPGGRPAGILTAGSAQYMVNVANQMPGDKVVILGSGDIGLIMARRMVLEGAEVRLVLGQEATGLVRNHIRCIQDFGIPFRCGWGLVSVHGYGRLQGVTVAPMRADGSYDMQRKEYIRCNTLLIACGLIPEREVLEGLGAFEGSHDERFPGVYVCGNANVPHDLVDQVTQEGIRVGFEAASRLAGIDGTAKPSLPDDLGRIARLRIGEPTGRMAEAAGELAPGWHRIVCTECPTGCVMEASEEGEVEGNRCDRGAAFARKEIACPSRLFTGTVALEGAAGGRRLLPVRTQAPVAKSSLADVARECRRVRAIVPVSVGDVIISDVAGTGVDLVAADDASACEEGRPA